MESASAPGLCTTRQERSALFVTTLTSLMGPLMISAVNVALPAIGADLAAGAVGLSWIATAYLLSIAVFLVPVGRLADIHGRKKIFVIGLVINTVGAFWAAVVPNLNWLIAMRFIQGAGAAMFISTGMAILISIFPSKRRGQVIGIYVAAVYVGLSAGPFVGGLLTEHWGWRSVFGLMLPLGTLAVLVTTGFLKGEWADAVGERFDVLGSAIYAVAILLLVIGATRLPALNGGLLTISGVLGLVVFFRHENRTLHPVFEVALFQNNRVFAFSSVAALIHYGATFALTFLLSLYLQYLKGLSPQTAGTLLVAQPIVMALISPAAGRLSDRMQPRTLASTGMAMTAIGLAVFGLTSAATSLVWIVADLIWIGAGFALFSSPNMNAIMGSVAPKYYGTASGTVATMRLLGQLASMALATVIVAGIIGDRPIAPPVYDLYLRSMHVCFIISALMCAIGLYFSMSRGRLKQ